MTFTRLHSSGTIFCSTRALNRFNNRFLAASGRFFNKLNLILSGPGAELLQQSRAMEKSAIENRGSRSSDDTSHKTSCTGTESGHTFLAKSKIHRSEHLVSSFDADRLRILLATFQRVLIELSLERFSTNFRQYPFFFALIKLLNLRSSERYSWNSAILPSRRHATNALDFVA